MRKKRKYPWQFIRKPANGNTAMRSMLSQQGSPSARWYRSISELPLNKFIECLVDGNLSSLIIWGFPAAEDLENAWIDLREQYSDTMGDAEHKLAITLFKEITILSIELQQIKSLIEILSFVRYKPLEDQLNQLVFTNFSFTDHREKELQTCLRLSKSLLIKLEMKTNQYHALKEKNIGPVGKPTREYFQSLLITLSDYSRYLVPDTITTFDFCERIKRLTDFIQKQKLSHGRR